MFSAISCRLCDGAAHFSFRKIILSRYDVEYFQCEKCKALQTEEPYWLHEAYEPINEKLDTGQFIRCLHNAAFLDALTSQLNLSKELLIDYGCGSGLTARILRDIGINAYGYDSYSEPRLLMGFLKDKLEDASIINLCEVAEHFQNPKSSFEHIFSSKPKIVVMQTGIFDLPSENWGYLAPEHGQHIFFYNEKTISFLANKYQLAVTVIQGYIVFIKLELLEILFTKNTNNLKLDFASKLNQSLHNIFNKILTNGYKNAIEDNLMLAKTLQVTKKATF
jgi:hypothetical protein